MSAPASQAALASGQLVMPQILTRIMAWLNRQRRTTKKGSQGGCGIRREHETLADEKSVETGASKFCKIVVSAQAGFADGNACIGDAFDQLEGGLDAQVQSFQVAVVDADDAGLSGERAVEFSGGVNFHDWFHADLTAESDEIAKKFQRAAEKFSLSENREHGSSCGFQRLG